MVSEILKTLEHQLRAHALSLVESIPKLIVALLVWCASLWIAKAMARVSERWMHDRIASRRRGILSRLLARTVFAVLCLFGFLIGLSVIIPSFGLKDFLGFLGISGVAVGLAFREVLQSFLAGVIIAFSGTFDEGDSIEIGDIRGKVLEIQLRSTTLLGESGERIEVPNNIILTKEVRVVSVDASRRKELVVSVDKKSDLESLIPRLQEILTKTKGVAHSPEPVVIVKQVDEEHIQLLMRWWVSGNWGEGTKTRALIAQSLRSVLGQSG